MRATGIDESAFIHCYQDGPAEAALESDLALTRRLGIHSLPAYLIRCGGSALKLQSFDYQDFADAIQILFSACEKRARTDCYA